MSSEDFDQFWAAYPKKLAKADARKAWLQTAKVRPTIEVILTAVSVAKESIAWRKDEGQFIPPPATWLRGERWEDEHEVQIDAPISRQMQNWWATEGGVQQKANQLGLQARIGESMESFKARIMEAAR